MAVLGSVGPHCNKHKSRRVLRYQPIYTSNNTRPNFTNTPFAIRKEGTDTSLALLSILQKVAKVTLNCKLHTKIYVLVVEVSVIQVCLPKHILDDLHNLKIKLSQSRLNT